jgi:hypothetical protein
METPRGVARDFERKLGDDIRHLITAALDLWGPHISEQDALNITLSTLAFCGVTICSAANAPPWTFATYAKTAEEILTQKWQKS